MNLQHKGLHPNQTAVAPLVDNFYPKLRGWNTADAEYPQNMCIHQLFEAQVARSPDAIAVMFEGQQLTYQQLNQKANQLAHYLRTLGVKPEVLVGIYIERSLEMIVGLLAILKAGGAYVPIVPGTPGERLSFILNETQASIILTQTNLSTDLSGHSETVVCLDSVSKEIAQHSHNNPTCETTSDNLIYVIYTSGSTGQPKGVMITHAGICNQLFWRQTTFPLASTDRVLQNISFSFDPSVWQIFWPLSFGAQLVLPRPGGHQDSTYLVKLIAQEQISVIALVPSMLRVFLEEKELEQCSSLRLVFCGGEALPAELQERFFARLHSSAVLHNVYGPTEASIDATFWTCRPDTQHAIAPIGRPITNAQVYILDPDLQPVAVGEPGELHIGGDGLARGYLNRPELTAEKFIQNPFEETIRTEQPADKLSLSPNPTPSRLYKTGDLARYLPNGDIEFLGRIDHQVKIRGFRIELGEIEATLSQYPSIQESVVVAREDKPGDKRLVAYLVSASEQAPLISDLRMFLKEKLPEYMVPSHFVVLEKLPLNSNGKVDRHALPAPNTERPTGAEPFVAPQTPLEIELCNLWAEALEIEAIGVDDNFFELGGDSLRAASLLTQMEDLLGQKLSLNAFLQAPTVRQQVLAMRDSEGSKKWNTLVPIQTDGANPPLFCVHARNGNVLQYYKLAHYLGTEQPFYGIQALGVDDDQIPLDCIEAMAAAYIKEMRSLQPNGPYFLSGYSFGGLVAYEMAQQLQAQGQAIAMLALIDTYSDPNRWFKGSLQARMSYHLKQIQKKKLVYVKRALQQATAELQNKFTHRLPLVEKAVAPDDVNAVQAACEIALAKYRPQAYSDQVTLIRASNASDGKGRLVKIDHDLGWKRLVNGQLNIHDIRCSHFELIQEPNVTTVAQILKTCLKEAQSNLSNLSLVSQK